MCRCPNHPCRSRRQLHVVHNGLERFLAKRLRLRVNREKSAVARPWQRKFLGYTVTTHRIPKLRVAPQSITRLKTRLRLQLRAGRGRSLPRTVADLTPLLRGWVGYFRMADVRSSFEQLDEWLRRRLRCILWRQWKRPRTRARELLRRGLDVPRAWASPYNGRGPWWNAGASHLHAAVPTAALRHWGLLSSSMNIGAFRALREPPDAERHVRWCRSRARAIAPGYLM